MESTAAAKGNSLVMAGDATDASFSEGELTAVGTPQQVATRFPSRKRVGCWQCQALTSLRRRLATASIPTRSINRVVGSGTVAASEPDPPAPRLFRQTV